jgi:hypothetical protein
MRRCLANAIVAGLGLALPLWAWAQTTPMPIIAPVPQAAASKHNKPATSTWRLDRSELSRRGDSRDQSSVPAGAAALLGGPAHTAGASVHMTTKSGVTMHAGVDATRRTPLADACAAALPGVPQDPACRAPLGYGVRRGEVGAGFVGHGVKLDLSVGQSQSESTNSAAAARRADLPRILPAQTGADVAAPLWFRDSTATSVSARGQVNVAPRARVDLGASVGRVRFLPGAGAIAGNTLDQATVSLGIQRDGVRGTLVGHLLQPALPGAPLTGDQRWSGIDLGISVRLPWSGELTFGARNLWSSNPAPLLFGPVGGIGPAQGRVPYVQYHQDM